MFGYDPPINIITTEMSQMIDSEVYKAVLNCDIQVDKDELLKALAFDRKQYEKGYSDGRTSAFAEMPDIVHCFECQHFKSADVPWGFGECKMTRPPLRYPVKEQDFCSWGKRRVDT